MERSKVINIVLLLTLPLVLCMDPIAVLSNEGPIFNEPKPDDVKILSDQNDYYYEKSCGRGEEFQKCGDSCEPTCDYNPLMDSRPKYCGKFRCERGCFCQEGYVRFKSRCIPRRDCPSKIQWSSIN